MIINTSPIGVSMVRGRSGAPRRRSPPASYQRLLWIDRVSIEETVRCGNSRAHWVNHWVL